jgi:dimethylhistidine N-methyltransferase
VNAPASAAATTAERREPHFIQLHREDNAALRTELLDGLARQPATTSPKFLYDALGSRLFDAITELAEYYPTRTEAAIFDAHAGEIAQAVGPGSTLIDLGAGNCSKGARMLALLDPARYVAVDISVDYLRVALRQLQREHPQTRMTGVGLDFSTSLALPDELTRERPVFFYAGSSIGNFTPRQAGEFLTRLRGRSAGGGLLIGVDLVKPASVLEPAYDDELGVTAAFNLNLLLHLNRLIGSDFRPGQWRHVALFNEAASRIEMHLEARDDLQVRWPGGGRHFARGERLHTENSYKYSVPAFTALLRSAGYATTHHWTDPNGWFAVYWAES